MEEDELRQIREARLRELKKNAPAGAPSESDKNDEMKASVLSQLISQDARERLNRVRIVKPERAEQVEQLIMRMGQTGQLAQRVTEKELVALLDQLAQRDQSSNRIIINRRETDFDRDGLTRDASSGASAQNSKPANDDDDDDDFFD